MAWKLKPDYRENLNRQTWEENSPGKYWNNDRIRLSADYQYDVYLRAKTLARDYSLRNLLDIGAGPGCKLANLLSREVDRLVMVDQPSVEVLARKFCQDAEFIATDLENISISIPEKFDLLICADVLEHLIDPSSCLEFIRLQSAEMAWIVFSTPERDFLHGKDCCACNKPEHVREWNAVEFAALLGEQGFLVVEHLLCPQIRPYEFRGNRNLNMAIPFQENPERPPNLLMACQIVVCRLKGALVY